MNAYSLLTYLLTVYIYVGITFTRIPFQCMKVRVYDYREVSRQKTFGSPSKQIAELKKKKKPLYFSSTDHEITCEFVPIV